jgi:ADP-ribosylglycohydrolase
MENLEDRMVGCILGGAIGDALGEPYEGQSGPVAMQSDAVWRLSDDTQLTLATCEAIHEAGAVSPPAIADRFACWFRQRRVTGAGASTLKALRDLEVAESVPLAIYAAQRIGSECFRSVLEQAIEAGGDTDTIASITGQIAGAWAGSASLPNALIDKLPESEDLLKIARDFARVVPTLVKMD